MDPNQQPNNPQEETPTTPAPDASTETPETSEVPAVTPVESVPVSEPAPETPAEPTTEPVVEPTSSVPEPAPTDAPVAPVAPEAAPSTDPAAPVVPVAEPTSAPVSTTGNPGFAFGLTALILSLVSLGLFGVIFGIVGLKKSKKAGLGNGLAVAGIIIGGIEVVFGILALVFVLISLPHLSFSS